MLDLFYTHTPMAEVAVRMGAAALFGAILGLDREARRKPAGLRTHMLISLASATLMLLTFELIDSTKGLGDSIRSDPVRVTEAIVTGVAFLGAGCIITSRNKVKGITTGASIWLAGAIGAACGGGYYTIAILSVLFAVAILSLLGLLENRLKDQDDEDCSPVKPE